VEISIKDVLRTGHVNRWQIVRTARQQTLAEHLYLVTMLSLEIADLISLEEITNEDKIALMDWSLNHDVPEVITGDIATPMKKMIRSMCPEDPFDILERQLSEKYSMAKDAVTGNYLESVVKMADIMDGIIFLDTEGLGEHAEYVKKHLLESLTKHVKIAIARWPVYDWLEVPAMLTELIHSKGNSQIEFEKLHG